MDALISPTVKEIKQMYDWNCLTNEDIKWYVDMLAIDREDYALITNEKYPESQAE
ncbi:XkdX family protein [Staphylococcus pseudoxylosus]|uniref:XkdX family protein n=2 Tax=Staphylococcus pseudoxylosus TaxID=2282419 RepID=A0AAQ0MGG9_9STAP|nr:XkdX family protein [Staphylococcus pseudoxylosus]MCE5003191.1 XkdX family protein [Staphylococcus pseudoxylosus]RMI85024.1 XkdX family protein [Staphylococcus pseudoxylosus]